MRARAGLLAMAVLAACSSGGGGGNTSIVPIAQWGTFRHDLANTGLGAGSIDKNNGRLRFSVVLPDDPESADRPSPAVGFDNQIFIGTPNGLLALDNNGNELWRFESCNGVPVGAVRTTPAVTAGDDLVVVADQGVAYQVHDEGRSFTCVRKLGGTSGRPFSERSSAQTLIDGRDRDISSVFLGTSDGGIEVLNDDGTTRFRFPTAMMMPLTSSPAVGTIDIYFTAPDGFLYAVDFAGRLRWRASIGTGFDAGQLTPSPVVSVAIYAVTAEGGIIATNPDGTFKWRYTQSTRIPGSPALVIQTVKIADQDNPGQTANVFEPIVYVVDEQGTLYGVRDRDGSILVQDRCSITDRGCVNDSDCPSGETCEKRFCSTSTTFECASDKDCPPGETCDPGREAVVAVAPGATITTSPAISTDLFAVIGTNDGRLCARSLKNKFPTEDKTPETPTSTPSPDSDWVDGCVNDLTGGVAINSSPVLDKDGRIYFVAGNTLYAVE